jgi:hypothetical protein
MPYLSPQEDEGWWQEYEVPADPYAISASHDTALKLLRDTGSEDGDHLINRMVFAHFVTALEAFLGDSLINGVTSDENATKRLIREDKNLNAMRFSLEQIESNKDLVANTVVRYLRSIQYHNLQNVHFLYKAALEIRILNHSAGDAKTITSDDAQTRLRA